MENNSYTLEIETKLKHKEGLSTSEANGEAIVQDFENGCYFIMNEVAARIWMAIEEKKYVRDIVKQVVEEYEIDPKIGEKQVIQFISQLIEKEWITVV